MRRDDGLRARPGWRVVEAGVWKEKEEEGEAEVEMDEARPLRGSVSNILDSSIASKCCMYTCICNTWKGTWRIRDLCTDRAKRLPVRALLAGY